MSRLKFLNFLKQRQSKYVRKITLREQLDKIMDRQIVMTESVEEIIKQPLQGIKYAIIGGHAINIHGTNRMTQDIDILINPTDWEQVVSRLGGEITQLQSPRPDRPINAISVNSGRAIIDLIWIDQPWAEEALAQAISTRHGNVISKPYLVLTKLWAGRGEQDDTDIISILRVMTPEDKAKTAELVRRHIGEDIEDFDQMIAISEM